MTINLNDILDFLVSRSAVGSNLGAQLEKMRDGTSSQSDPFRSRDEVEANMIRLAGIIRCVDAFAAKQEITPKGQAIEKINRTPQFAEGSIALGILRAYHERSSSPERGLVEVYRFLAKISPRAVPSIPQDCDDLLQAFRDGNAKRCRFIAAEAYADALLGLQNFVRIYNKKFNVSEL